MWRAALLLSLCGLAAGRRSPHADLVEEYYKNNGPEAGRYSNNLLEDALLDVVRPKFVLIFYIQSFGKGKVLILLSTVYLVYGFTWRGFRLVGIHQPTLLYHKGKVQLRYYFVEVFDVVSLGYRYSGLRQACQV